MSKESVWLAISNLHICLWNIMDTNYVARITHSNYSLLKNLCQFLLILSVRGGSCSYVSTIPTDRAIIYVITEIFSSLKINAVWYWFKHYKLQCLILKVIPPQFNRILLLHLYSLINKSCLHFQWNGIAIINSKEKK